MFICKHNPHVYKTIPSQSSKDGSNTISDLMLYCRILIHVAVNHLAADIGALLQGGTIPQPGM